MQLNPTSGISLSAASLSASKKASALATNSKENNPAELQIDNFEQTEATTTELPPAQSTKPRPNWKAIADEAYRSIGQIAAKDLPGALAVALAQVGTRALEQTDSIKDKAKLGKVFLDFFKSGPDTEAAALASNTLSQASPTTSGAASAYQTTLRELALDGATSVAGVGFDLSGRDTKVLPQDDFFKYVNGGWIEKNPIPASQSRWGRFNELSQLSVLTTNQILQEYAAKEQPEGSIEQKLGDFYFSASDTASIEAAGIKPIEALLHSIDSVKDSKSLQEAVVSLHDVGISPFFSFGSVVDAHNSSQKIGGAYQGGLGLPSKDYYIKTDEKSVKLREDYKEHIKTMLTLLGQTPSSAKADAEKILAFETGLADSSLSKAEARNPEATYNIKSRAELDGLMDNFSLSSYLNARGLSDVQSINVGMPKFFQGLDKLLKDTPLDTQKAYLRWNLVNRSANFLPQRFDSADFEFYGKTLKGAPNQGARETRAAGITNNYLGMALGKAYVERVFSPEAKERAFEMISNIRDAIGSHIKSLDWMSEDTKKSALEKLESVRVKVGYPDEWPSYDGLEIKRGEYGNNVLKAQAFQEAKDLAEIGKPVDKAQWHMSPSTVNAYYSPSGNEIVFPAAILQPPFFNAKADDAINYGGIGMVIGHEFTHGFDDKGSQYAADGNLSNWWTAQDRKQFEDRAGAIKEQAKAYEVAPGLRHNPDLILGEALADLGGAQLALTAYQNSLKGKDFKEKIDGMTPEQRFFHALGQIWASNSRPEYVEQQIATDPHPVAPFRVNQTVKNVPAFAAAFKVNPDDPMSLAEDKRAQLW